MRAPPENKKIRPPAGGTGAPYAPVAAHPGSDADNFIRGVLGDDAFRRLDAVLYLLFGTVDAWSKQQIALQSALEKYAGSEAEHELRAMSGMAAETVKQTTVLIDATLVAQTSIALALQETPPILH